MKCIFYRTLVVVTLGNLLHKSSEEGLPWDYAGFFIVDKANVTDHADRQYNFMEWMVLGESQEEYNHFSPNYMGCYRRNGSVDKGFADDFDMSEQQTTRKCVNFCSQRYYPYAGLQYGMICLCGHSIYQLATDSCRRNQMTRCAGDEAAVCGADDGAVDVYRVCIGSWGVLCEHPCPKDCQNCEIETGDCIPTCGPGMQALDNIVSTAEGNPHQCQHHCLLARHYGPDCKFRNDNCLHRQVHPINGHCLSGCMDGYYGLFCDPLPVLAPEGPTGPCPACPNCKDQRCGGEGESSYYGCPLQWQGNQCAECPDGMWGDYCSLTCPTNCISCKASSGECKECIPQYYGSTCELSCPHYCTADQGCSISDAMCFQCTADGRYGEGCLQLCGHCIANKCIWDGSCPCLDGYWGSQCTEACPVFCKDGLCDQQNGECRKGCQDGYTSAKCKDSCPVNCLLSCHQLTHDCDACKEGFHGLQCTNDCNRTCKGNRKCEQEDGKCSYGCIGNFTGDYCTACPVGLFGHECTESCPDNCADSICDPTTATCVHGCIIGFHGLLCTEECSEHCIESGCDQPTGNCMEGCIPGWQQANCMRPCQATCKNKDCHWLSGECLQGCVVGYTGPHCAQTCSENCAGDLCDQFTNQCLKGCKQGFKGPTCMVSCSSFCINSWCQQITGECLLGCEQNVTSDFCLKNQEDEEVDPAVRKSPPRPLSATDVFAILSGIMLSLVIVAAVYIIIVSKQRVKVSPGKQTQEEGVSAREGHEVVPNARSLHIVPSPFSIQTIKQFDDNSS